MAPSAPALVSGCPVGVVVKVFVTVSVVGLIMFTACKGLTSATASRRDWDCQQLQDGPCLRKHKSFLLC